MSAIDSEASSEFPKAEAVCDGGDLDCGSGLLLIIRSAMAPLESGAVLEVRSRESSVREDLPAWCRMVGHQLLAERDDEALGSTRYAIRKKGADQDFSQHRQAARDHRWRLRVRWDSGLQARVFARNHSFDVGQPASFDTNDAAPSAVEHLLGALGACLTVGFQWRCSQRGLRLRKAELSLSARLDNPFVFLGIEDQGHPGLSDLEGKLYLDSDAPEEELRTLWNETIQRSPVAQSLARACRMELSLRLME